MIIDHNLINYLTQVNARGKLKKISSLNQAKDKMLSSNNYNYNYNNNYNNNYNGLNENIHIDYERKNKARRSLLYLLNKMSGGTFCPQIVNYFKEIRELKKQEEQLKEVKEEDNPDEPIIIQSKAYISKNNKNILPLKNPILVGQNKNNYLNYKFNRRSGKDNTFRNEEKNAISKHYANDFGLKDMEHFIDSEEIEKVNGNKFNYNKEAKAKKKFLEEYTIDEEDRYYSKKGRNENKKYKSKIEYDEEENNGEEIETFKKLSTLKIPKLNRLNTISGRVIIKKNSLIDKEKSSHLNKNNVIKEEI